MDGVSFCISSSAFSRILFSQTIHFVFKYAGLAMVAFQFGFQAFDLLAHFF